MVDKQTGPATTSNRTTASETVSKSSSPISTVESSLKDMVIARSAINDARDDMVVAFTVGGVPLKTVEHRSIQGPSGNNVPIERLYLVT